MTIDHEYVRRRPAEETLDVWREEVPYARDVSSAGGVITVVCAAYKLLLSAELKHPLCVRGGERE